MFGFTALQNRVVLLVALLALAALGIQLALSVNELALHFAETPLSVSLWLMSYLFVILIACGVGVQLSGKAGLGCPIIAGLAEGKTAASLERTVAYSLAAGVALALFTIAIDSFLFGGRLVERLHLFREAPIVARVGLSFSAAVGEELLFRYVLMSLLVWLIREKGKVEFSRSTLLALALSSLAFGGAHLFKEIPNLDHVIIVRALLLGGIGGSVFGLLYWKKGLAAAMIAHFTTDVSLYVGVASFV